MPKLKKEGIQQTKTSGPEFEVETLARLLLPALQAFYESPEGRAEYERWKERWKAEHISDTSI